MSKHTQGKWCVGKVEDIVYQYDTGNIIAVCGDSLIKTGSHLSVSQQLANARLIAKAPEMYELLILLKEHMEYQGKLTNISTELEQKLYRNINKLLKEIDNE